MIITAVPSLDLAPPLGMGQEAGGEGSPVEGGAPAATSRKAHPSGMMPPYQALLHGRERGEKAVVAKMLLIGSPQL